MSFNRLSRVIVMLGAVLAAGIAQGQGYPAKTIRWIVPWPPGGGADVLSRISRRRSSSRL
jgi:tripartite-type tricarboxylate transporter receptor subunit TctC